MPPLPRAPARRRDREATRTALLDAAETAFCERGFHATAMRDVAAAAGVTKSLIHHHFGSKESLWQAVFERRFREYEKRQRAILERAELDLSGFEESVRAWFRFLERNPELVRLQAWANAGRGGDFAEAAGLTARGVKRLREIQARGILRADVEPASVLVSFFALVEHWFQSRAELEQRFGGSLPEAHRYLEDVVRILVRGIRA